MDNSLKQALADGVKARTETITIQAETVREFRRALGAGDVDTARALAERFAFGTQSMLGDLDQLQAFLEA